MKTNKQQLERIYDRLSNAIATAEQTLATLGNWPKSSRLRIVSCAVSPLQKLEIEIQEGVETAHLVVGAPNLH